MDSLDWHQFEINAWKGSTKYFETRLCKELFAIQNDVQLEDVIIFEWLKWIENVPINGIAYQSKYLTKWDWRQIKDSLNKALQAKLKWEKPFNELIKIIVYVKDIKYNYLNDQIINLLKDAWIELEIFNRWDIIWNDKKYNYLKQYFQQVPSISNNDFYDHWGFLMWFDIYYNREALI